MLGIFGIHHKKLCFMSLLAFAGCNWWQKPPTPAQEEVHQQQTHYTKGIVNYENEKDKSKIRILLNNVDISNFPAEVRISCTVVDSFGNHVTNLAPPYNSRNGKLWKSVVEVWADSTRHPIKGWQVREVRDHDAPPFTSALVVDYSGSMVGDVSFLDSAVTKAVTFLRPQKDDYGVVQFDHRVFTPVTVTSNPKAIEKLMSFKELGGATAFYDGSLRGLNGISQSNKTPIGVLFTDGWDNSSFGSADDVIVQARKISAHLFVIGFGGANREILQALAEQTGGKVYFPSQASELSDIFEEIYRVMKAHYVITYKTQARGENRRRIEVALELEKDNPIVGDRPYYLKPEPIAAGKRSFVVLFETAKSAIRPEYMEPLERIAALLKNNPGQIALVRGHTDSYDTPRRNLRLSKRRAVAVQKALQKAGVAMNQIAKVEALGETELFHKDDRSNDWKAKENRRTEIILL